MMWFSDGLNGISCAIRIISISFIHVPFIATLSSVKCPTFINNKLNIPWRHSYKLTYICTMCTLETQYVIDLPYKYISTYQYCPETSCSWSHSRFWNGLALTQNWAKQTCHQSACADESGLIHTSLTIRLGYCEVSASLAPCCTWLMSLWTISSHLQWPGVL